MTKQKIFITVALLITIAILGYFGYRGYQYAAIDVRDYESYSAFLETNPSDREVEIYTKKLEEAEEEDTYGSTTPEGTMDLFISALEEEDTELAAKYFVAEQQKEAEERLRTRIEEGSMERLIGILKTDEQSSAEITPTRYLIDYFDDTNTNVFAVVLIKYSSNDIWKIENF